MARLPIRARLTLAFACVMAVVLTILGFAIYLRFEDGLYDSVDRSLRSRANDVEALVQRSGPRLPDAGPEALVESEESFAQLLTSDGRVIDGTPRVEARPLLTGGDLRRSREHTLTLSRDDLVEPGDPVRVLAHPIEADGREMVLVVGAAVDDEKEALDRLRLLLLVGLPAALVLASLAGYGVAAAALRPVEAMRRKASAISAEGHGERLPVPGSRDEIGLLGDTLNAMLERLESGMERERRFVADASHELRTPLAILKTELELALREGRSAEQLREALRSAAGETDRLNRLADDLLVLARSDRGSLPLRMEAMPARQLLQGVADRFRVADGEIAVEASPGLELRGDRLRLEQALGNLVSNALGHGEGPVRLFARQRDGAV
jgi:two-component system, OmpR family, sensor kinase